MTGKIRTWQNSEHDAISECPGQGGHGVSAAGWFFGDDFRAKALIDVSPLFTHKTGMSLKSALSTLWRKNKNKPLHIITAITGFKKGNRHNSLFSPHEVREVQRERADGRRQNAVMCFGGVKEYVVQKSDNQIYLTMQSTGLFFNREKPHIP